MATGAGETPTGTDATLPRRATAMTDGSRLPCIGSVTSLRRVQPLHARPLRRDRSRYNAAAASRGPRCHTRGSRRTRQRAAPQSPRVAPVCVCLLLRGHLQGLGIETTFHFGATSSAPPISLTGRYGELCIATPMHRLRISNSALPQFAFSARRHMLLTFNTFPAAPGHAGAQRPDQPRLNQPSPDIRAAPQQTR